MAHSVESLFDPGSSELIREQWHMLRDAGLPSSARNTAAAKRPHCTLLAGARIGAAADDEVLPALAAALPVPVRIGAPVLFRQHRQTVLARLVVPDLALLSLQARAHTLAAGHVDGLFAHFAPGEWTPHVTLGRMRDSGQLAAALDLLDWSPIGAVVTAVRHWDGDAQHETIVPGPGG